MARQRKSPEDEIHVMSLRISAGLHEQIKLVAEAQHRTVSQEVRRALEAHVEQATKEAA